MNIETTHTARVSALRSAALRIFGMAGLACVMLFAVVGWLASGANAMVMATLLIGGILCIIAVALFQWQRISERRIERLITQLQAVERSRDEAETARADNERMLAAMSHEIRTPLNGVIGMLNLLLATPLSAEQTNYARTAHASGRSLLSIIEEILDTAKGRASDTQQPSHIRSTVENVVELLAARAHAKSIEISAYVSPHVPEKLAFDDTHIRQILFNLAGNAIKFTETGGVGIEVTCIDHSMVIVVKDTGIGMTPDELDRVFQDFQQANRTTARKFGGTGLGLGITKRLVTQLGGTISVVSEPAQGTSVTVRLPLPDAFPATAEVAQTLRGHCFGLGLKPGITAEHLRRMLQDQGAELVDIDVAAELQAPKATRAVTIIADSSATAVLRKWAAAGKRKRVPSHRVWTLVSPEERQSNPDLLGRPFCGYLLKPVRPKSLMALLAGLGEEQINTSIEQLRSVVARASAGKHAAALSILLVDDNAINLLLTRTMLEKAGHRVTTATDGGKALAALTPDHQFGMLLLDVDMPVMDGYATARALRAREQSAGVPPLPILGLTAHMRQEDLEHCIAAGMDDYLSKPFDQHDLMVAIDQLRRLRAA